MNYVNESPILFSYAEENRVSRSAEDGAKMSIVS